MAGGSGNRGLAGSGEAADRVGHDRPFRSQAGKAQRRNPTSGVIPFSNGLIGIKAASGCNCRK
jgi:hypothetical protein